MTETQSVSDLPVQRIRKYGWKPDKPDIHDKSWKPTAIKLPKPRFFLDPRFIPSRTDQGNLGSCTGWGVRGPISYVRCRKGETFMELSPLFAYYNGRVIENTIHEDAGCEIRDVIKGVHRLGIASEVDWPYIIDKFAEAPSQTAYANAKQDLVKEYRRLPIDRAGAISLRALKEAAVRHQPVTYGFTVYESFDYVGDDGMMPMPKRRDRVVGGHAIWHAGYDNLIKVQGQTGALLIANSWGEDWGCAHPEESAGGDARTAKLGYFWMPYAYLHPRLSSDAWAIKTVA